MHLHESYGTISSIGQSKSMTCELSSLLGAPGDQRSDSFPPSAFDLSGSLGFFLASRPVFRLPPRPSLLSVRNPVRSLSIHGALSAEMPVGRFKSAALEGCMLEKVVLDEVCFQLLSRGEVSAPSERRAAPPVLNTPAVPEGCAVGSRLPAVEAAVASGSRNSSDGG